MAGYVVGHDPTMPGSGKTVQAVVAARCLEDIPHALHNDNRPVPTQDDGRGDFDRIAVVLRALPANICRLSRSIQIGFRQVAVDYLSHGGSKKSRPKP
jgi:hypothetical protein